MKYTYFEINNFKGIEKVRIDIDSSPKGDVYTLVGLNESGKTTVLEGINLLTYREDLDPLDLPGYGEHDIHDLIPIAKRANFNDSIMIEAGFMPTESDEKILARLFKKNVGATLTEPIGEFHITQAYKFENSTMVAGQHSIKWNINLVGKLKRQRIPKKISSPNWAECIRIIKTFLPSVVCFPNFLFEFPDKIYLENPPDNPDKHNFYCTVLQDVLDAIGDNTNLQDHVLSRAKSSKTYDKRSLESGLLKVGAHITKTVFENWDRIFKRPAGKKEIIVDIEQDDRGVYYLQLRLKDGSDLFAISERSLGFRWFFTFLLLTHYRGFRSLEPRNVLFLIDEPASNLHPSAQTQLIDSFTRLPTGCGIIYTTHSHHMIKPEWLENAFVVKNEGLDYTDAEDNYSAKETKIILSRYREFASRHPEQYTYFQPILDVLNYCPGQLENVPDVVMLEGKNDFYILKYMCQQQRREEEINLMPGGGAGSLDQPIQLYFGWGRNFIILLDSDGEGKTQKNRYLDKFGLGARIFTLADADESWGNNGMESLFTKDEQINMQTTIYPDSSNFNKTHFNRAIQELYLTDREVALSEQTKTKFGNLIDKCISWLDLSIDY